MMPSVPAGYCHALSPLPGDRVALMAAGDGATLCQLERLVGLQGAPTPTAYVASAVGSAVILDLQPRDAPAGSFAECAQGPEAPSGSAWSWRLRLWPGLTDRGDILVWGDKVRLSLSDGAVVFSAAGVTVRAPLQAREWTEVSASVESDGLVHLRLVPIGAGAAYRAASNFSAQGTSAPVKGPLRFGQGYSGKISGPACTVDRVLAAQWDFSVAMTTQTVPGVGPHGRALKLVNAPKRAVTGPAWTGEAHDWRQAPAHYDAIHFHDDDIADCAWPSVHDIALPEDLSSGVYAVALTHASGGPTHRIPLFVRPRTTPRIVFLASTLSYLAYANSLWASPSAPALEAGYPDVVGRMRRFGLSTYSRHRDGSGIGLVSTRRPTLNLTPGFLGETAGGQSLLNDDLRILAWLERIGEPYCVLTDHDLHREGVQALKGCAVLVTGAHPEYQSRETLDAIEAFQGRGGRLLYLGGNGFYWRVSILPDAPHVMEVRRAEGGIRMWAEPPGEYHHQSDGGLGGLWRRLGRPPNRLVGVGYSAQGDEAPTQPYRRMPAADDPRASFLFEGVDSAVFGRSNGIAAAAGYELDRADPSLGTPAHALVVARSEPFSDGLYPVNEERLTHTVIDAADPLRADLTFFETPSGGATLSVGSVFFPLALEEVHGAGRLARNALERFLDPTPFAMPAEEDPS